MRSIHKRRSSSKHSERCAVVEALEDRRLLSAVHAIVPADASDPFDVDGAYSVSESWSVTVTNQSDVGDSGAPVPTFTVTGVAKGKIQVVGGNFNLINDTGHSNVGTVMGTLQFDGSQYTVESASVLHGTVGSSAIVRLGFTQIVVPLHTDVVSIGLTYDDGYTASGSDLSDLEGEATAGDGMEPGDLEYDASAVATLRPISSKGGGTPGAPPALTPTIGRSTLPAAVVAGSTSRQSVTVDVANSGGASSGSTTVQVYASNDGAIDDQSVLLGTVTRDLRIRAGGTLALPIRITSLPSSLSGAYTLLAQATDPTGNMVVSDLGPALTAAPPFIQPEVSIGNVIPSSLSIGKSASVLVTVTNGGNIAASGVDLTLSASADGVTPVGDVLENLTSHVKILPGKSKTLRLHFKVTSTLMTGNYYPYLAVSLAGVQMTEVGTTQFAVE